MDSKKLRIVNQLIGKRLLGLRITESSLAVATTTSHPSGSLVVPGFVLVVDATQLNDG